MLVDTSPAQTWKAGPHLTFAEATKDKSKKAQLLLISTLGFSSPSTFIVLLSSSPGWDIYPV